MCQPFFFLAKGENPPDEIQAIFADIQLNSNGGDEGFDQTWTFPQTNTPTQVDAWCEMYTIKDHLRISTNSGLLWDTGCVSGRHERRFIIPAGSTWLRIKVIPNCEGTSGTAWVFEATTVK